jgi:hypothetical protein
MSSGERQPMLASTVMLSPYLHTALFLNHLCITAARRHGNSQRMPRAAKSTPDFDLVVSSITAGILEQDF